MYVFFPRKICYNKNAEREKPIGKYSKKDGTTMNINIIGKQVSIRDDMKALAEKKLAKFDRYFPEGADSAVTVKKDKDQLRVEVTISVGGTLFRAEESSSEFKNALTRCIDLIEGQIRKNKSRLEKRMKDSFAAAEVAAAEAAAGDSLPVVEEGDFEIRKKTFLMKPMTPEEAILQMNLLGHSFYVFEDAENGEMCVVYKRNAGSYGLIIPDKQKA